jgi:hypothetical protein
MSVQRHVSFGGHSVLEQMVLLEQGIASLLVMVNRFKVCVMVQVKHLSCRMCHIIHLLPYFRASSLPTYCLICLKFGVRDLHIMLFII